MRWSYKMVHYPLKKEGLLGSAFLDETEIEVSLNEYGKAGWELVSMLDTMDGVLAVFKQALGLQKEGLLSVGRQESRTERKQEVIVPSHGHASDEAESMDGDLNSNGDEDTIFLVEGSSPQAEVEKKKPDGPSNGIGLIKIE